MEQAGAHGRVSPVGNVQLPVVIGSPADDRSAATQPAGMRPAGAHRGERAGRDRRFLYGNLGFGGLFFVLGVLGWLGHVQQPQSPRQKRRHLIPRHRLVRTEPQRLRRATLRHPSRSQRINVGRMEIALRINKPRRLGRLKTERPHQERRHLIPRHRLVRTEPQRLRRATLRHPQLSQTLNMSQPPLIGVHIREARLTNRHRLRVIKHTHQPHTHRPTLHLITRTEHLLTTLGALEHPQSSQRINTGLVHPTSHIREPAPTIVLSSHRSRRHHRRHQHPHNQQPQTAPSHTSMCPTSCRALTHGQSPLRPPCSAAPR